MSSLSRELVFLILEEKKFEEMVHNMKHFEEAVLAGEWEEVEKHLSGFTKIDDNRYSMKIFFEIRKQKYLEAFEKHEYDRSKAVDLLVKDLKFFSMFNEDLFKEITQLLTLENFRENEKLKYGDSKSMRATMLTELKKLMEVNPLFRDKLQLPSLKNLRLRALINLSLIWQHQLCKHPRPNPDIKTLLLSNLQQSGDNRSSGDVKPITIDETIENSKIYKLAEINEPSQCYLLKLTDNLSVKAHPRPSHFRALPLFIPTFDPLELYLKGPEEPPAYCFSPFEDKYYLLSTPEEPSVSYFSPFEDKYYPFSNPEEPLLCCFSPFEDKYPFEDNFCPLSTLSLASMLNYWAGPLGTNHGWLVLLHYAVRVVLLNPIFDVMIELPQPPPQISHDDSFSALSPPPNYVAYFIRRERDIHLCRRGDTFWTTLPFAYELSYSPCAATTSTGELYLLSRDWELFVVYPHITTIQKLDMNKACLPKPLDKIYSPLLPFLMESNGDILLVLKNKRESLYPSIARYTVFEADFANRMWVRLESLGDRVLFIHSVTCASFSVADVGHGVKGNCIYFSMAAHEPWEVFDLDTGAMTDGSLAEGPFSQPWDHPHRMIMPSMC